MKLEIEHKRSKVLSLTKLKEQLNIKSKAQDKRKRYQARLRSLEIKLEKLNQQSIDTGKKVALNDQRIDDLQETISSFNEEIKEISSLSVESKCPKCQSPLDEQHVLSLKEKIERNIEKLIEERVGLLAKNQTSKKELSSQKNNINSMKKEQNYLRDEIEGLEETAKGLTTLENEIQEIEEWVIEVDKFDNNGDFSNYFPKLNHRILEIQKRESELKVDEDEIKQLRKKNQDLIALQEKKKHILKRIKALPRKERKLQKMNSTYNESEELINSLENELVNKKFLEDIQEEIEKIKNRQDEIKKDIKRIDQIRTKIESLDPSTIAIELEKIGALEKSNLELKGKISVSEGNLNRIKKEIEELENSRDKPKFSSLDTQMKKSLAEVMNKEKLLDKDKSALQKTEFQLEGHQQTIKDQIELRKEIKKLKTKIEEQSHQADRFDVLESVFKHIGERILSRLRTQINISTIDTLGMLGNPQLLAINLGDDFDLTIQTPDGFEKPGFFSGGQKVRIGFAFRLALSQVLAEFRGNELETLIIDEGGFGALDEEGQQGVVDVFNSLQNRFARTLIISHISQIADKLPGEQISIENGKIRPV